MRKTVCTTVPIGTCCNAGRRRLAVAAARASTATMVTRSALTSRCRTRGPLQENGVDAAGSVAQAHHAGAGLASGPDLRHADARGRQPRPRRLDIRDPPAQPPQLVVAPVRAGNRPVHDLDDEIAAPEEHQPAPVLMRAVERHVEPEPRAV